MVAPVHPAPRPRTLAGYLPQLDGLRAVACLAVVLFHLDPHGQFSGGFIGVDIFFVLSAYLITGVLCRNMTTSNTLELRSFYWNRFLRLAPALGLFLLAYILFAPLFWPGKPHIRDSVLVALYITDYSYPLLDAPRYLRHTWSLAIEEKFYLLWPFALLALLRAKHPVTLLVLVWLCLTLWRAVWTGQWEQYYYRFDTRATGLIAGAALFFALRARPFRVPGALIVLAAATLLAVAFNADIRHSAFVITLAELAAVVLVAGLVTGGNGWWMPLLANPVSVFLGKLSYGIYLWHFPIALFLRSKMDFLPSLLSTLGLSVILAALSYWTVEKWARNLKAQQQAPAPAFS